MADDDKLLKNVILIYDDGAVQTKKPRETLAEAFERMTDPDCPYNKNKGDDQPKTEDIEAFIIKEMNRLGSYIDIAIAVYKRRGFSLGEADQIIRELLEKEVF